MPDTVEVGDDFVTLRSSGGKVKVAKILDKVVHAASGKVASVLLDRVVHDRFGAYYGWKASGVWVTEFKADPPPGSIDRLPVTMMREDTAADNPDVKVRYDNDFPDEEDGPLPVPEVDTVADKWAAVLGVKAAEIHAAKMAELRRVMVVVPATAALTEVVREWAAVKSRANGVAVPPPHVFDYVVAQLLNGWLWPIPPASEEQVAAEVTGIRHSVMRLDLSAVRWEDHAPKGGSFRDLRAWLQGVGLVPPDDVQELFPAVPDAAAGGPPAAPEIPPAVEPEPGVTTDEQRPEADPQPAPVRDGGEIS